MEVKINNTVNLDLETYNELREFRDGIQRNGAITVSYGWNSWEQNLYTNNEAITELAKANEKLKAKIEELTDKKQPTVDEIKKMSCLQFCKWKRT
ncbi:MAG: hypothetical protein JXR36_03790 [Bacteroidales bacterium]|nr:hypothetical protein [Bacteroidales bacterium]